MSDRDLSPTKGQRLTGQLEKNGRSEAAKRRAKIHLGREHPVCGFLLAQYKRELIRGGYQRDWVRNTVEDWSMQGLQGEVL